MSAASAGKEVTKCPFKCCRELEIKPEIHKTHLLTERCWRWSFHSFKSRVAQKHVCKTMKYIIHLPTSIFSPFDHMLPLGRFQ